MDGAAELGAQLSGMEFSSVYGMAPAFGSQTKGRGYQFARYYRADGTRLEIPNGLQSRVLAMRATIDGPVYARLELAPPQVREAMRWAQPNFFLPFEKLSIDPFTENFEIRLVYEGTVRGTGGLLLAGPGRETQLPGLYAAGDVATRELITGSRSGGGSHNGAWAISSGTIAGQAAAAFARDRTVPAAVTGRSGHGLGAGPVSPDAVIPRVQAEVLPAAKNLYRTEDGLRSSLDRLDSVWVDLVPRLGQQRGAQRAREAAAMTAHARWMYRAALARRESRGAHRRDDYPATDSALTHRLRVSGLDMIGVSHD